MAIVSSLPRWRSDVEYRHVLRSRLIVRDGPRCHYCREVFTERRKSTFDHVWPRSLGGRDWALNLVLACARCNSVRGCDVTWCRCWRCSLAVFAGLLRASLAEGSDT